MPSIFSRTRTHSTPHKISPFLSSGDNSNLGTLDEFGRVTSRSSSRGIANAILPSTPSKKDKKKAKEQEKRSKTLGSSRDVAELEQNSEPQYPEGSFLPLNFERPKSDIDSGGQPKDLDYGYLCYERHVVLNPEHVSRLVDVVSEELETRGGITEPFIFSTTALDISSSAIRRLIRTFLDTCKASTGPALAEAEKKWREEACFAGPHELGMCLRWGLARVIRSVAGQDVRGLVSWEHYVEFRDSEAALGYPPNHFEAFVINLITPVQAIVVRLLSLLSRLTANSVSSGHTPPSLSPLFGPLLFGLGPATLAFHHAYIHYLRAVNATEHVLLAFIRWQDTPQKSTSSSSSILYSSARAAGLGVPIRLKEWIKGYPSMLPALQEPKNAKPHPRKGARTVRVMSVRRNVRMYSPDLVKSAASWGHRKSGSAPNNGLVSSREWERIAPSTLKLPPRYSEAYKKRMNMPANFNPETGAGPSVQSTGMDWTPSTSSHASSSTSQGTSLLGDQDYFGLGGGPKEGEDRFRSLTDFKWGEFESMGFGSSGSEKKLQFDLTESARTERTAKRATLSWNDFSSAGFSRSDGPLSATLQFSAPVTNTLATWPAQNAELNKKLKKAQKNMPAFGWDTEPVIGNEEVIEEAFIDVFCDLIYGGGWMDLERGEELDRDCNWALIEFKSLPPSRTTTSGGSDPRTSTTLILFEEFVPFEYRQQLAVKSSTRRRLPLLFSSSGKSKQWKQAATLNGRPYVVGHVPRSPSYREMEFEGLLRGSNATKVITLSSKNSTGSATGATSRIQTQSQNSQIESPKTVTSPQISRPLYVPELERAPTRSEEMHSDSTTTSPSAKRMSRFKLPGRIPVPSPGGIRKSGILPAEYSTVEFETRMASYSDDEHNASLPEPESVKQKRRESKDDAWVDILVGGQLRRMGTQDELDPAEKRRAIRERRSDPELASLEVAQVLAAVQNRSPSPPSFNDRIDRDYGMDHHVADLDVDEIDLVPRALAVNGSVSEAEEEEEEEEEEEVVLAYTEPDSEYSADADEEMTPEAIIHARQVVGQQGRLGYFDLHPERRPAAVNQNDEDPRLRLARDDSDDDDDDDDEQVYGRSEQHPPPIPSKDHSSITPIAEPPRHIPPVRVEVTTYDDPPQVQKSAELPAIPITPVKPSNPVSLPVNPSPKAVDTVEVIPVTTPTSKTAALIEMYRERERGALPKISTSPVAAPAVIAPLAPSRLPTYKGSVPKESPSLPPTPFSATPSPKTSVTPSPKLPTPPMQSPPVPEAPQVVTKISPSPSDVTDLPIPSIDPPRILLEETGRASPARYVHGAPLHNVLEEEEEEM